MLFLQKAVQNYNNFFNQPNFFTTFVLKISILAQNHGENQQNTIHHRPKTATYRRTAPRLHRRHHPCPELLHRSQPRQAHPRHRPPPHRRRHRHLRLESQAPEPILTIKDLPATPQTIPRRLWAIAATQTIPRRL